MFHLHAPFSPAGDQPGAIRSITRAFRAGDPGHVLLGVTGSGKTYTMANVIQELARPALIIAPNKTLAAQLYVEFRSFFPKDSVGYFISYYDYYQPEAYIPGSDTYIAKDSSVNQDIDKMRHEATRFLFEGKNTIIVASVSCIYGLGSPENYVEQRVSLRKGQEISRNTLLRALVDIQYTRNDIQLSRGAFRVRGDTVDILPSHQRDEAVRLIFFGDEIEELSVIDSLTGKTLEKADEISIYPGSHYVTPRHKIQSIVAEILEDLGKRLRELRNQNKLVEAQRLEQRTLQDIESIEQIGFCPGIENYSRYLSGQQPGQPPPCLLDYFPEDYLTIIDESHITIPQIGAMYRGDRSRKETLVEYGFRLPSALDNRPLNFEEFLARTPGMLCVSATPGPWEMKQNTFSVSEQIIRPTGLTDPKIHVIPAAGQVDDLYGRMKNAIHHKGRVLITTLTKKMAEDLCQYYQDLDLNVRYLHSDIDSLARSELLKELRQGIYDVLIGINLLREGLDLPEVRLVAVMDADKEGFLRSARSLIQIVGRAARNHEAEVIFYADQMTDSMQQAIDETSRRRKIQTDYNETHGIIPRTIIKPLSDDLRTIYGLGGSGAKQEQNTETDTKDPLNSIKKFGIHNAEDLDKLIRKKTKEMQKMAGNLEFEKAAHIRDELRELQAISLIFGKDEG
ncbi:MAG: excinuclease ABC subunit UvrB [Deltaproteobacteria bacterium]|nr:excinuclease ABC subunit UvrB [Deltaproteobacteria bacterium]